MSKYEKRIEELTKDIDMRTIRFQKFVQQNAAKIEQEKAIIQQKIGALQEIRKIEKEEVENKNKDSKKNPPKT